MKKLRYVCVQPRILYYAWQVEVMINNFLKQGINGSDIDILVAWNKYDETSSQTSIEAWSKLVNQYTTVNFHFYEDTRERPIHYISSIRPNLLKQHWVAHPELKDEVVFYHDCDIVFTRPPDFTKFLNDDTWYVSDTNSYINSKYILSKGEEIYNKMCEIVGLDPEIPKQHNNNSGGAQYIIKNVDADYWHKVERDCEKLYFEVNTMSNKIKEYNPKYHELQIWCADMWAVLWNAWLRNIDVKVTPELQFSWATDQISKWDENLIYHNAGVTCACGRQFYKGVYMKELPYNIQQDSFSELVSSYNYVKEIIETGKKSCLI